MGLLLVLGSWLMLVRRVYDCVLQVKGIIGILIRICSP